LGIWPASIILSRWAVQCGSALMGGKVVVELGAGCGLPGIAAGENFRSVQQIFLID
jgi:predicted nicotinamide N-methyase